jgi:hypothetical protein
MVRVGGHGPYPYHPHGSLTSHYRSSPSDVMSRDRRSDPKAVNSERPSSLSWFISYSVSTCKLQHSNTDHREPCILHLASCRPFNPVRHALIHPRPHWQRCRQAARVPIHHSIGPRISIPSLQGILFLEPARLHPSTSQDDLDIKRCDYPGYASSSRRKTGPGRDRDQGRLGTQRGERRFARDHDDL